MKKKLLSMALLTVMTLNMATIKTFAMPNLTGLSEEEKIQVIDNSISESIEKITNLEKQISDNELKIKEKQKELFNLHKEYQAQKKQSNYSNSGFLRTNSNSNQNQDLKLFELLLKSDSIGSFFQTLELNKTTKFKKSRQAQLMTAKEDYLVNLQEELISEQDLLITDKEDLTKEKLQLDEMKKEVEKEIAKRPKINNGNITPPDISIEASPQAKAVIEEAFKYLGTPYVWGGTTPSGFDCSGFTKYIYSKFGINLPRVSQSQQNFGQQIPISDIKPGDLIFNGYPAYHVSIYIGNGQYIHAPQTGDVVKISTANWSRVSSASRVLN